MARTFRLRTIEKQTEPPAEFDSPERAALHACIAAYNSAAQRVDECALGLDRAKARVKTLKRAIWAAEAAINSPEAQGDATTLALEAVLSDEPIQSEAERIATPQQALDRAKANLDVAENSVRLLTAELERRKPPQALAEMDLDHAASAVAIREVDRLMAILKPLQEEWIRQRVVLRALVNAGYGAHRLELEAARDFLRDGEFPMVIGAAEFDPDIWTKHPARQPWDEYLAALKQDANAKPPK